MRQTIRASATPALAVLTRQCWKGHEYSSTCNCLSVRIRTERYCPSAAGKTRGGSRQGDSSGDDVETVPRIRLGLCAERLYISRIQRAAFSQCLHRGMSAGFSSVSPGAGFPKRYMTIVCGSAVVPQGAGARPVSSSSRMWHTMLPCLIKYMLHLLRQRLWIISVQPQADIRKKGKTSAIKPAVRFKNC